CRPYNVNVWPGVGVTGLDQLSWTLKTSTSLMLCVPAKSTSSQSGQLSGVPSVHHVVPFRSPSIAPLAANPGLCVDEPIAVPPLAPASRTRMPRPGARPPQLGGRDRRQLITPRRLRRPRHLIGRTQVETDRAPVRKHFDLLHRPVAITRGRRNRDRCAEAKHGTG